MTAEVVVSTGPPVLAEMWPKVRGGAGEDVLGQDASVKCSGCSGSEGGVWQHKALFLLRRRNRKGDDSDAKHRGKGMRMIAWRPRYI